MNGLIKKYLPYAIVIFAVFLLVPLLFIKGSALEKYSPVAFYFILLTTAVVTSAIYCAKHGIDFLFTLMAPIAFLFTMIYSGGFRATNIILLFVYLIAGIFGQFLGDLAFGDERRKKEKQERAEQEKLMLRAKRRDERKRERTKTTGSRRPAKGERRPAHYAEDNTKSASGGGTSIDDVNSDFDKYMADIDRMLEEDPKYNS